MATPVKRAAKRRTARGRTAKKATAKKAPAKKAAGRRGPTLNGEISSMAVAKGIGRYLEECHAPTIRGRRPMSHRSTEQIEASIAKHEAKIDDTIGIIKELDIRNKIQELRLALRENARTNGSTAREFFVEHGAEFAERKSIMYGTFREMGVPAAVLKEASINP